MPTVLTDVPIESTPRRKRWTRAEYDALAETGLFEGQHLELIEGELIDKMGKKRPHVTFLVRLMKWLTEVFGADYIIPESPIDVAPEDNPTNEPEPDLIVLNRDFNQFLSANPRPHDLRLVIEVADSTVGFDLTTKAALYARAGIVDYWVLDVPGRRLIVHRSPQAGHYASVVAYSANEGVAPLAAPDSQLPITSLFQE
jgi:Uma2 family endonuclease